MKREDFLKYLILIGVIVFAFSNSYQNDFVYDDIGAIQENVIVHSFGNVGKLFTEGYWGKHDFTNNYRPLLSFTFMLQYSLHGENPALFRLINILLHIIITVLIYQITRRLSGNEWVSYATALIFAVHPIHVEAVAGIVGRGELLSSLFILLSIWFLISDDFEQKRIPKSLVIILCFFLGMISKENTIILPFLLLLILFYRSFQKSIESGNVAEKKTFTTVLLNKKELIIGFGIVILIYFAMRYIAFGDSFHSVQKVKPIYLNPATQLEPSLRPLIFLRISAVYTMNLFYPIFLSPDYSYNAIPISFGPTDIDLYISGFLLLSILVLFYFNRKNCAGMFIVLFGINYLPMSNLLNTIGTLMGDRLMYLPSWFICFLVAFFVFEIIKRIVKENTENIYFVLISLIMIPFLILTLQYNDIWKTQYDLFNYAERIYPESFQINKNLASASMRQDPPELEGALRHALKSKSLVPDDYLNLNNLGTIYYRMGKFELAKKSYLDSLKIFNEQREGLQWPPVYYNLGNTEYHLKNYRRAIEYYNQALESGAVNRRQIWERIQICRENLAKG